MVDFSGLLFVLEGPMAKLAELTASPGVNISIGGNGHIVKAPAGEAQNWLVLEEWNGTRVLDVIFGIVTGLSLVEVSSSSAPGVKDSRVRQGHRVEVSAADLNEIDFGVDSQLHWLLGLGDLLLVPSPTPAPDLSLFC